MHEQTQFLCKSNNFLYQIYKMFFVNIKWFFTISMINELCNKLFSILKCSMFTLIDTYLYTLLKAEELFERLRQQFFV